MDIAEAKRYLNITSDNIDEKSLKVAFRAMAKKYHPDVVSKGNEETFKLADGYFKKVNEAYNYLLDNYKKLTVKTLIHVTLFEFSKVKR